MKKVLIIGYSGMVGSRFVSLSQNNFEFTLADEKTLDITNPDSVNDYFSNKYFDSVVNFAAFTNVDAAEKERGNENGLVWKLNVKGPQNLSSVCKEKNIFLVQISTDFVFDGTNINPGPYAEDATIPKEITKELGWYGWSKNRAEHFIWKSGVRNAIVRIAYPFYSQGFSSKTDFAKNYIKLYDEGKMFPIFTDQTITPINVDDMVKPLGKILNEAIEGVFHLVSADTTTPFEFVKYLLKKTRSVEPDIESGSIADFLKVPGRTPRPRLGGLKTEITQKRLGIKFNTWREMIDDFAKNLKQ